MQSTEQSPQSKFDKSAEGLWATQEGPFMVICTPCCYESTWLKIRTVQHLFVGDGKEEWRKTSCYIITIHNLLYIHFQILALAVMNFQVP